MADSLFGKVRSNLTTGAKIPPAFAKKLKSVFPNDPQLHKYLDSGDTSLVGMILFGYIIENRHNKFSPETLAQYRAVYDEYCKL